MYFLTDEWNTWHYTLMDRNLWATEVYTWVDNVCTYGYYYQWWNKYGFPTQWTVNTSSTQVNAWSYSASSYSGNTFIIWNSDWTSAENHNLWWDTTNTESARRWPCPSGYHVPSMDELENIINN